MISRMISLVPPKMRVARASAQARAIAKFWCTEVQGRVLDRCVQLHGGYGYMTEYAIARAWADARATRIFGGTNEIMREIIGRSLEREDHDRRTE